MTRTPSRSFVVALGTMFLLAMTAGCPSGPGMQAGDEPLTADEAARFLAVVSACPGPLVVIGPVSDGAVGGVISASRQRAGWSRMARCVGRAGSDCAAIAACGEPVGTPSGTCETATHCEGALLRLCVGPPGTPDSLVTIDCSVAGLSCVDADAFGCGVPCTESTCDPDGRGGLFCAAGVGSRVECAEGWRCTTEGLRALECVGDGAACEDDTCTAEGLLECDATSRRARPPVDCGDVAGICDAASGQCAPSATECVPGAVPATCEGSVIRYCSPSHTIEVLDCAALGFASCLAVTGSGVYCRPA